MNVINGFLNNTTMYRLMLYYLIFLVVSTISLSFLQILPFNPLDIILEALFLITICWISNKLLAKVFKVSTNPESPIITGLILSLIIGPVSPFSNLPFLSFAAILAMASKYLITINKRHIFNPVGFGVVASAVILSQGASWWIGNILMLPFILLGGILIFKKIKRWEMVLSFLLVYFLTQINKDPLSSLLYSPVLFFVFVMLVEPLTSPATRFKQILYGGFVALTFFAYSKFFPQIFYGLEASLLTGNVLAYVLERGFKVNLRLKSKEQIGKNIIKFNFEPSIPVNFQAGQFLEWTLSHKNPDSRGTRRYFTIASSPTETSLMMASKFYDPVPDGKGLSTFKKALQVLNPGDELTSSYLGGEFTLPQDKDKKLVFIAGGIGVTPFRSMIKWLIDKKETRDTIFLYSNKSADEIVFKDIFEKGEKFGVRTIYVNTKKQGYIDEKLIKRQVPDFKERMFYVSGPEPMVQSFEKMLKNMGIAKSNIKRDYFPGYTETHTK